MRFAKYLLEARDKHLFFVCGFQRSGTNWMNELLRIHPDVCCDGEYRLDRVWDGIRDACIPDSKSHQLLPEFTDVFQEIIYYSMLRISIDNPGKHFIGERTPRQLLYTVPDAKNLYMVRDCREVIVSSAYHELNMMRLKHLPNVQNQRYDLAWHHFYTGDGSNPVGKLAQDENYFEDHPEDLLTVEYIQHMAKQWSLFVSQDIQKILDEDIDAMVVRYMDLFPATQTAAKMTQIFEYLGVAEAEIDTDQVIEFDSTAPGFSGVTGKTQEGLDADQDYWVGYGRPWSFRRAGRAGEWQQYFNEEKLAAFYEVLNKPDLLEVVLPEMFKEKI